MYTLYLVSKRVNIITEAVGNIPANIVVATSGSARGLAAEIALRELTLFTHLISSARDEQNIT